MKKHVIMLWLVGITLLAVFVQLLTLGDALVHGIPLTNTLDLSWQTDSVERLLQGYIAGQDFIFTYGPLFQFIYSLPAIIFDLPSYISILYASLFVTIINIILLFTIILLTFKERKTALILTALMFFVVSLFSFDQNTLLRMLLPFLYGLLLFRFVVLKKFSIKIFSILFLPAFFGLYTFDLFFLGLLITILFIGYSIILAFRDKKTKKYRKQYIAIGTIIIFIVLFSEIAVSLLLSGNLNYLRYSLDTVQNYQFVMSIPWSITSNLYLLFFPLGLCLLILYTLKQNTLTTNTKISFIILTIIALLQIKSAVIRADDGHIIMGIYPSLIILFILFFALLRYKVNSVLILLVLCFYLLIPIKNNYFENFSLQNFSTALSITTTSKKFSSVYQIPENYYFSKNDFRIFESVIQNNPGKVMVYPYDSYILNAFEQTFNTVGLQMYQYSNSLVEEKTVEALQKSPPKFIILGIDTKGAVALDNIPNFSRNPLIAKWMIQNYSVEKNLDNFLILRFNQNKPNNERSTISSCSVYEIDTSKIMETNPFEGAIKSSTFYLNTDSGIRLPYMPNTKTILMIENSTDSKILEEIFDSNIQFDQATTEKKHLKIIKKFPIPKLQTVYEENFSIKCYHPNNPDEDKNKQTQ